MRKTLLIAAAALAAGVISSEAQVYSQNIVGYVNIPIRSGYNLVANPLNNSTGTNLLSTAFGVTSGSAYDGSSSFLVWNGSGYSYFAYDSAFGGWIDANFNPTTEPVINPGRGFFFQNNGASNTVTVVGSVAVTPGSSITNNLVPGYSLVGSPLPYGGVADNTNLALPVVSNDGAFSILQWNPATQKYVYSAYDSAFGGWIDANYNPKAAPTIGVGEGFFYNNNNVSQKWVQSL